MPKLNELIDIASFLSGKSKKSVERQGINLDEFEADGVAGSQDNADVPGPPGGDVDKSPVPGS